MLRLEDKETAEFRVGDVLSVQKGYDLSEKELNCSGNVAYIKAQTDNNGIYSYVDFHGSFKRGISSVDVGRQGVCFVHTYDFFVSGNNLALIPENEKITDRCLLYLSSAIMKKFEQRSKSYGRLGMSRMNEAEIPLPVTSSGEPDWEWMDAYIRQIEDIHVSRLKFHNDREAAILRELHPGDDATETGEPEELDLENKETAEFRVGDLFDLDSTKSGIDGIRVNNSPQEVPYITRSEGNNGISKYISPDQDSKYQKDNGNVITIGLDTQTAYYQSNDFFTGQNVHVLSHSMLNMSIALFVIPHIKKQMSKYNWGGNGATLGRLRKDVITLPVTPTGEPDWEWMDAYICQIEERERANRRLSHRKEEAILAALARR